MHLKRILKHLWLTISIFLGIALGASIGFIYYLNQEGLNSEWRQRIANELEERGLHTDFESLRYSPTRGLVAENVRVYANRNRDEVIATLKSLTVDIDKTKIMRGKLRVNNVFLGNASISLPIDPNDPDSPRIIINELQGEIRLPNKNTIAAQKISGVVAGINLTINAHLWSRHLGRAKKEKTAKEKEEHVNHIKAIANIIEEINRWNWPKGKTPHLTIYAESNLDDPDSTHLDFSLSAETLSRDTITIHDLKIKGDYNNKMLTCDQISFSDGAGTISAQADFLPNAKKGRFKVNSSLHLQMLLRKITGKEPLPSLTFSTPPKISCVGTFDFSQPDQPQIQLTGQVKASNFSYLGTHVKNIRTEVSLNGSNVFLTNLKASLNKGSIKGRILIKDRVIRYETESSIPPSTAMPFIVNPIAKKYFNMADFTEKTTALIKSNGIVDLTKNKKLNVTGHCQFKNFSYKGVAMESASADYQSTLSSLTFSNIKLVLNQKNYSLRKKYGGPLLGLVNSDEVVVDLKNKMVHIKNVRSSAWPAPVVRLFHTPAADHCEAYQFLRPPTLTANGSFDLNRSQARTNFNIDVRAPGSTHYKFLGEYLTLQRLKGKVQIRQHRVDVTDLSFQIFQGASSGQITVYTQKKDYEGEFQWSRLHLEDLGKTYGFKNAEHGLITGRIDFKGHSHDITKFNGKGAIGLEHGNLFSVPMLGPLSPLIGKVLGDRNPTEEQAENASCTYLIRDGVVYSNNFLANTRSLRFTGEGRINLDTKNLNLLVRLNARGLFSFLTLPLKPFMGLFQFQGTGNFSKPKWKSAAFTTPKRGRKDPIFRKPPKAKIIQE